MKTSIIGSQKINTFRRSLKEIIESNGVCYLYSYEKCVGIYIPGRGFIIAQGENTKTTNKHINFWLKLANAPKEKTKVEEKAKIEFAESHKTEWNSVQTLNYFGFMAC